MSQPKVLFFVTTHPQAPYIYPTCWRSILDIRWNGPYEMVVAMDKFPDVLSGDEKTKNYSEKYIRAQKYFLASDCDAMLTLESDHIFPPNALEKMIKVKADIVYGLYCSRPNKKHVWMLRRGENIGIVTADYSPEFMRSVWNKVVPSDGLGTGCTLIHRKVIEELEFKYSPGLGHDWYLAKEAKAAGFIQMHDCRVIIGHILNNQNVVWPDPNRTFRVTRRKR
jgi:hypothetical protein